MYSLYQGDFRAPNSAKAVDELFRRQEEEMRLEQMRLEALLSVAKSSYSCRGVSQNDNPRQAT